MNTQSIRNPKSNPKSQIRNELWGMYDNFPALAAELDNRFGVNKWAFCASRLLVWTNARGWILAPYLRKDMKSGRIALSEVSRCQA